MTDDLAHYYLKGNTLYSVYPPTNTLPRYYSDEGPSSGRYKEYSLDPATQSVTYYYYKWLQKNGILSPGRKEKTAKVLSTAVKRKKIT